MDNAHSIRIANVALSRLGTQATIASFGEQSTEAFNVATFWGEALDATLAEFDWRFATCQVVVAETGTPPSPWHHQYALPGDCIRVRAILPPVMPGWVPGAEPHRHHHREHRRIAFARGLGLDALGNQVAVVLTDQRDAQLLYTARVSNPGVWEPGFRAAFTWRLAAEIAVSITGKPELQTSCMAGYQQALAAAEIASAQELTMRYDHEPDWMRVRGLAPDWTDFDRGWGR